MLTSSANTRLLPPRIRRLQRRPLAALGGLRDERDRKMIVIKLAHDDLECLFISGIVIKSSRVNYGLAAVIARPAHGHNAGAAGVHPHCVVFLRGVVVSVQMHAAYRHADELAGVV